MSAEERGAPVGRVDETVDLRRYVEPVVRQKRLALLTACVVFAACLLYTFTRTPVYRSTATVLVKPTGVNLANLPSGAEKLVDIETEARVVRSMPVAERAAPSVHAGLTPAQLLDRVSVAPVVDTLTLEISFRDTDPSVAQEGASAFARAYLAYRAQQAQELVASQLAEIDASLAADQTRLRHLNATIASSPPRSASARNARTQRKDVLARVALLEDKLTATHLLNTDPGTVIVNARTPKGPIGPNRASGVVIGLLLGLAAGVAVAFIRGRMDRRVHTSAELEEALGSPLLASIPWVPDGGDGAAGLITVRDPEAPASEAFRALRATLMAVAGRGEGTLMVVSALPGEGKTMVAANLSVALAAIGKRVVLVSADMRRPRVHEMFGLPNGRGLSSILSGEVPADLGVLDPEVESLYICPGGPPPAEPGELLLSQRMRDLVEELRGLVEYVVLDAPPVLTVADALALAPLVDGVLFVVDARSTERQAVAEASRRLEQVGVSLLGGVLNKVPPPGPHEYGYGYRYGQADVAATKVPREAAPASRRARPSSGSGGGTG
jgi:capsular exopolysaccharide synthesis family protein